MKVDVFGALKRMFTLPKSKNSLSDLLGKDAADAVVATVHTVIGAAATQAMHSLSSSVQSDLDHVRQFITTHITLALANVSPQLATEIGSAVNTAVTSVEQTAITNIAATATAIIAEVGKVLKV